MKKCKKKIRAHEHTLFCIIYIFSYQPYNGTTLLTTVKKVKI